MSSPKKIKQSSLTQFYKKTSDIQHPSIINYDHSIRQDNQPIQQHIINKYQSHLNAENNNTTLQKDKSKNNNECSLSIQMIEPSYLPESILQQQSYLDIHSNKKQKPFNYQNSNLLNNQYSELNIVNQRLFDQKQTGQKAVHRFESLRNFNQEIQLEVSNSDINCNMEFHQGQEIKLPNRYRIDPLVSKFEGSSRTRNDESKLSQNVLITPENSVLKSPSSIIKTFNVNDNLDIEGIQYSKIKANNNNDSIIATPKVQKPSFQQNEKEESPPSSEIIERLKIYNQYDSILQSQRRQNDNAHNPVSPKSGKCKIEQAKNNLPFDIPSIASFQQTDKINQQKTSQNKQQKQQLLSSDEDEDSSQLIRKIKNLQNQVTQLKTHKYEFAINKYRQQCRAQLQKKLHSQIIQIDKKYSHQQSTLKKQSQMEINLFKKSLQDITKYKKTYAIILGQLKENKQKINLQYTQKVQEVNKFKERLINQWKRNTNQEIKKILNNTHNKYSVKLSTGQKQKPINIKSQQHLMKEISGKSISPFLKEKGQNALRQSK